MCGICGEYANRGFVNNDRVIEMARIMESRGRDSTGYIAKKADGKIVVKRDILPAGQFFEKHPLKDEFKWIFVHTRGASCGGVKVANAHPFDVGTIVGMQNGFCFSHATIAKEMNLPAREVDSHTLFDLIQAHGEPLEFGRAWAGALVWYDKKSKKLELRDNTTGSLFEAEFDGVRAFASTRQCLNRVGFPVEWNNDGILTLTMEA